MWERGGEAPDTVITPGAANGGSEQQTPEFMLNNQFTEHCFSLQAEGQLQFYSPASRFVAIESQAASAASAGL